MLIIAIALAGLAPGVFTAWRVHRLHGWIPAILAGTGVTIALVAGLLISLAMVPGLAVIVAAGCLFAALRDFDRGHIFFACAWVGLAAVFMSCAGWTT